MVDPPSGPRADGIHRVGLLLSLGHLRLRVDTNHINFFSRNHPLGQSAAVIDSKLAGVYSYQLMLRGRPNR